MKNYNNKNINMATIKNLLKKRYFQFNLPIRAFYKAGNKKIQLTLFILLVIGFQFFTFGQVADDFSDNGELIGYTTNNESSLPDITRTNDRYRANLVNNAGNITLHFNNLQGRLDAKLVTFPFEYIARNIGIGTQTNSQLPPAGVGNPYIFAGIQVHVSDLDSRNSSHIVVGHRGSRYFTVEGKNTVNGSSSVNDEGLNAAPNGRADLRIVGNADNSLTIWWQLPSTTPDNWTLYKGTGNLPGNAPVYSNSVYIGLITYAQGSQGIPYVGTCDAIEFPSATLSVNNVEFDNNISITPNPASDTFTIDLRGEVLENITIYNELGQQIKKVTTEKVNISNLSTGIYFVKIISQSGKETTKKIIKN